MSGPQLIAGTPDIIPFIAAGMDPRTGLPKKAIDAPFALKESLQKTFRVVDEQDAVNRYVWHNLPLGLNSQMMERILYYKGQAIFFYLPRLEKFFFLPYALDGTIDVYGRYQTVTPIAFAGGTTSDKNSKAKPWIPGLKLDVEYDIVLDELWKQEMMEKNCVIVNDYTQQISQKVISRAELQAPIIDLMSEIVPYCRTALQNSTGVSGVRVTNEDEQANVFAANIQMKKAALEGRPYIPVVGGLTFQEMTHGQTVNSEEFLLTLQALDNLRLSHLGLSNGGLFQKKSHMLEAEQQMNAGVASLIAQDGLTQRQRACDIINSIWGIGVWCEISEPVIGMDNNLDGELVENTDDSVQEEAVEEVTTNE